MCVVVVFFFFVISQRDTKKEVHRTTTTPPPSSLPCVMNNSITKSPSEMHFEKLYNCHVVQLWKEMMRLGMIFFPLSPPEKGLTEVYGDIGILLSRGRLTFQRRGE